MDVVLPTLARFYRDPQGTVYPHRETVSTAFWKRYLNVFDQVTVLARVLDTTSNEGNYISDPIDHPDINIQPLPRFEGPMSFVSKLPMINRTLEDAYSRDRAYILRVPNPIGSLVGRKLRNRNHPYGVEVCGDAENSFGKGAYEHPLRPFLKVLITRSQKKLCRNATAISYVTEQSLQEKYPASKEAFETHYSSIHLTNNDFATSPKSYSEQLSSPKIVSVGSLEQLYKGPDTMLKCLSLLDDQDVSADLTWLGGGKYRSELQQQANELGIDDRIQFLGRVSSEQVHATLDNADLFVLPSRMEGLPRAMIEAMARGLPCIGTTVGGIPELLPKANTVPPDDPCRLAETVESLVADPERMTKQAAENFQKAKTYHEDVLNQRRDAVYQKIQQATTNAHSQSFK